MPALEPFRTIVRTEGVRLYRDLPWRRTHDPYAVWVSEVMLQQTQVSRVVPRWQAWLDEFPTVFALAAAPQADVLAAWQGMGYNRRALALKAAAEELVARRDGEFPRDAAELVALPGIGPATAQGIRAFAFDLPGVYLETNVRTVFLHHFFPDVERVSDKELAPLVEAACPEGHGMGERGAGLSATPAGAPGPYAAPQDAEDTPRSWYWALLDYGAHLKRTVPNPGRRSSAYTRQSRFEGSRRQKRSELLRALLAARERPEGGLTCIEAARALDEAETRAGRPPAGKELTRALLEELAREGFCAEQQGRWSIV